MSRSLPTRRDERGSLTIGMIIMMVVGLLAITLVARATSNLTSVRRTQDFASALASADGGMADFLFQLDQEPATATLTGTGTLGEGTFSYTATKLDRNEWTVGVLGTVNGVSHGIEATVSRPAAYPYAIFTQQDLDLNGTSPRCEDLPKIYSYDEDGNITGNAFIGSNRAISVNGGASDCGGGDGQHFFTPDGSCSGCYNAEQQDGPRELDPPEEPTSGQACPVGGIFPSSIDGQDGTPFICKQDISFYTLGPTDIVNPPAIIYVAANYSVTLAKADLNPTGLAKDLRILKDGTGLLNVGSGSTGGHMVGVLYAPFTDATVDGGQMFIEGSLTLNSLTINGTPNFTLAYDDSILDITSGEWSVSDWREVPSSTL